MPYLATQFTVIAPDLIGHGESAKPRGDYSLGAYASGVRDLMVALGHESATFVGHSLGGGVVMQLAYQFPERCERLVLVDSGGLGREVNLLLRAATLPLSEVVLPVLASTKTFGWLISKKSPDGAHHALCEIRDLMDETECRRLGPVIETHPAFPNHTNVQFARPASRGDLDYLCFETMAEATISAAQVRKRRDPSFPGYDTYLDDRMQAVLPGCIARWARGPSASVPRPRPPRSGWSIATRRSASSCSSR